MRRLLALLIGLVPAGARAACPCYAPASTANTHNCGVDAAPGTNPTVAEWQPIFTLVSGGPAAWGTAGPAIADITEGCGTPQAPQKVPPAFPCELLKAIAMNESGWTQFCVPTTPADEVGGASRTIIAFDCGYGVGQVTSGMHTGETPAFDRARVAGDATYNLATGTQILADKWRATQCVGDRRPSVIEDWYTATWAYNGLAYSNNPNNPAYDAMRPVCDPNQGCPNRPYQERVFGWVEYPRSAAHWSSVALAYPNRGDVGNMTGLQHVPALPEPSCAGPTDCVNHRSVHPTACGAPTVPGGSDLAAPPVADGGAHDGGADDASVADAGAAGHDAGRAMPTAGDAGCGCRVGGRRSVPPFAALLLLALIVRRRASHPRS